jgi:hypothetical protein
MRCNMIRFEKEPPLYNRAKILKTTFKQHRYKNAKLQIRELIRV